MPQNNDLLTLEEAARLLAVSPRTLMRWHAKRQGPPRVNAGRKPLYRFTSIQTWLEKNETHPIKTFTGANYENA